MKELSKKLAGKWWLRAFARVLLMFATFATAIWLYADLHAPLGDFDFKSTELKLKDVLKSPLVIDGGFLQHVVGLETPQGPIWTASNPNERLQLVFLSNQCSSLTIVAATLDTTSGAIVFVPRGNGPSCTLSVDSGAPTRGFPRVLNSGDHLTFRFLKGGLDHAIVSDLEVNRLSARLSGPLPAELVGTKAPVQTDSLSASGSPLTVQGVMTQASEDGNELLLRTTLRHKGSRSLIIGGTDVNLRRMLLWIILVLSGGTAIFEFRDFLHQWFTSQRKSQHAEKTAP